MISTKQFESSDSRSSSKSSRNRHNSALAALARYRACCRHAFRALLADSFSCFFLPITMVRGLDRLVAAATVLVVSLCFFDKIPACEPAFVSPFLPVSISFLK